MAYQKTEWIENETLVSASLLNKIEDQLESVSSLSSITTMDLTSHKNQSASVDIEGHVQLSNAIDSEDETTAATSKAVKQAYDLANNKQDLLTKEQIRKITFGQSAPSGGNDGDIYFQYE